MYKRQAQGRPGAQGHHHAAWLGVGRDVAVARARPVSYTHLDVYKRQDLGAAPGGWSQWVRQELNRLDPSKPGRVIASDILEMPSLSGVDFLHGDFREDAVLSQLLDMLNGDTVDLVLSDMAPNKSCLLYTSRCV